MGGANTLWRFMHSTEIVFYPLCRSCTSETRATWVHSCPDSWHAVWLKCKTEQLPLWRTSQCKDRVEEQTCTATDETFYLFVKAVGAEQLLSSAAVPADLLVTDQAQLVIIVLSYREEENVQYCHSHPDHFTLTCKLSPELVECAKKKRNLIQNCTFDLYSPNSTETALSPPAAQFIYWPSEPIKHIIGLLNSPKQQSRRDYRPWRRWSRENWLRGTL